MAAKDQDARAAAKAEELRQLFAELKTAYARAGEAVPEPMALSDEAAHSRFAEENRSWLWGWANPQFGPEHPAVANPRDLGARLAVPELTTPELDLTWYDGPARSGGDIVAMATTGLLGSPGTIPGGYDGGVAYFVIQDASAPTPGWDSLTAPRMITSGLTLFPADHRLTVAVLQHRVHQLQFLYGVPDHQLGPAAADRRAADLSALGG